MHSNEAFCANDTSAATSVLELQIVTYIFKHLKVAFYQYFKKQNSGFEKRRTKSKMSKRHSLIVKLFFFLKWIKNKIIQSEIRVKWNGIKVVAAVKYKDEAIAISYDTAFSLILQTFMIFCKARPRKKLLLPGKKAASV